LGNNSRFFDETDCFRLVPYHIRKDGDDFLVIKKGKFEIIKTSAVGVEVLKLLGKGNRIIDVKQWISEKYKIEISLVKIDSFIELLWESKFIYALNGELSNEIKANSLLNSIASLKASILTRVLYICYHKLSIKLSYRILKLLLLKKIPAPSNGSIKSAYEETNIRTFDAKAFCNKNRQIQRQILFDRILFFSLSYKNLDTWLNNYFKVENIDVINKALSFGKGAILCGFHSGSYNIIPFAMAKRGVKIHSLAIFEDVMYNQIIKRIEQVNREAFPLNAVIHNRSGNDGLKLFRLLKNKATILLYCDTHVIIGDGGVLIDFLGKKLKVNKGIPFLHKRTEAPIIPVMSYFENSCNKIVCLNPIMINDTSTLSDKQVLQNIFLDFEHFIRKKPEQWSKWVNLNEMIVKQ